MNFITHENLIYALRKKYPNLVHGKDYLVSQLLDPETGFQSADAEITVWIATEPKPDIAAIRADAVACYNEYIGERVRRQRDGLLTASDWTQAADVPNALREKWVAYRQALRDITSQQGFPTDIKWPVVPSGAASSR
ncbi:phage tail assembly chaperone [Burkholderia plantarii]|uniref:tail fiber assembly protein n=1 Tax=Burkholderia plantarii TaxID=41899 RepID=UPI00272C9024|nr:tail fiber assembly protein [Burkholderia plantarii]WLE59164.1 phage tail assembly chaperone [Burkholderia plantarii]